MKVEIVRNCFTGVTAKSLSRACAKGEILDLDKDVADEMIRSGSAIPFGLPDQVEAVALRSCTLQLANLGTYTLCRGARVFLPKTVYTAFAVMRHVRPAASQIWHPEAVEEGAIKKLHSDLPQTKKSPWLLNWGR